MRLSLNGWSLVAILIALLIGSASAIRGKDWVESAIFILAFGGLLRITYAMERGLR
jgi:hypothetical protein